MNKQSQFIVIEGLEGAGKTTAINVVSDWLTSHAVKHICTREPGGTPVAEALRNIVKAQHDEQLSTETELLLMYAARSQLLTNVIKPALARGTWVLGDRHNLSSLAYQGGGRQVPDSQLQALTEIVLGDFRPNLTLYLDVPAELGLQRARGRGELDRIEQESLAFFERARQVFLDHAKRDSSVVLIDATQSLAQVKAAIETALNTWLAD